LAVFAGHKDRATAAISEKNAEGPFAFTERRSRPAFAEIAAPDNPALMTPPRGKL
jgi:hypothetical protein